MFLFIWEIETARCSLSTLRNFVNDPTVTQGLEISSQSVSVSANPDEADQVLIGSYILFDCKGGYTNTDNNLNVICNANGQWTTFPSCIPLSTTIASGICFICAVESILVSFHLDTPSSTTQSNFNNNADPMSTMNGSKRKRY